MVLNIDLDLDINIEIANDSDNDDNTSDIIMKIMYVTQNEIWNKMVEKSVNFAKQKREQLV